MEKTYYLEDLARALNDGCQVPGCAHDHHAAPDEIFLHGRCHLHAGVDVCYKRGTDALAVACRVCGKPVAKVAVAKTEYRLPLVMAACQMKVANDLHEKMTTAQRHAQAAELAETDPEKKARWQGALETLDTVLAALETMASLTPEDVEKLKNEG